MELKTPVKWSTEFGIVILDADGWSEPGAPSWYTSISREEFVRRMSLSTIRMTGDTTWAEFSELCK
jgi:hypothetical protein